MTSISYKKTKDIRLATFENRDTETFTSVGLAGVQHCEHTGHGFQGLTYAPSSGCGYLQSCCRTCWYRRYRTRTWSRTDSSSFCKRESGPVRSGGDTSGTTKYRIPRDPAPRCYGKPAISSQSPEPTAARSRLPAPAALCLRAGRRRGQHCGQAGQRHARGSAAPPAARRTGRRRDATVWEPIGTDRRRCDARPLEGSGYRAPSPRSPHGSTRLPQHGPAERCARGRPRLTAQAPLAAGRE